MKSFIFFSINFLILISLISCKKDFLDKTPDEDLTLDSVFLSRSYSEKFLNNIYHNLPNELNMAWHVWMDREMNLNPFVGASDEVDMSWTTPYSQFMNTDAWSASDVGVSTPQFWSYYYQGVRKANIFLTNLHNVPMSETDKKIWRGEATFLRAFFYFLLIRVYGPVPLIKYPLNASSIFKDKKREPLDSCIDFIVKECNIAAELLPMKRPPNEKGRATKAAALALKARLLLYAASPLWNGNQDYANMVDKDGIHLFPQKFEMNKWQIAANAAKKCIDLCEEVGYGLYYSTSNDPVESYQELFLDHWNKEVLFGRNCNEGYFEQLTTPTGEGGWGGLSPTQELVDAYQMSDGSTPVLGYNSDGSPIINPNSGYKDIGYASMKGKYWPKGVRNMYVNREPRFYASINYNGAMWKGRQLEFYSTGLDGPKGGPDYPICGYLIKKFSSPLIDLIQNKWVDRAWIYFRLGEQYLNYAEALNEAQGPVSGVYKYVNLIRKRAGLPNLELGLSQDQMRQKIRHERRIELAFETERYFDCRRWKIAENTASGRKYGMNIYNGTSIQDDSYYQRIVIEKRSFIAPRDYLWYIPQKEIDKDTSLIQNPGW